MSKEKIRTYCIDGDSLEVAFSFDEESKTYLGDYPDFEEEPRYTPGGKPWVSIFKEGCPYVDEKYNDCGSCNYLEKEEDKDLIGICNHPENQK